MEYQLDDAAIRSIQRRLSKVDKLTRLRVAQRRRRGGPSGGTTVTPVGNTFQLIKGTVTDVITVTIPATDYDPEETYHYCEIQDENGIQHFEEKSKSPSESPVKVAFDDDDTPAVGDIIWAAYHSGIVTIPPTNDYDEEIDIDWFKIATGKEPEITIVLIDDDIHASGTGNESKGIIEDDPVNNWESEDILLTEEETSNGVEVVFQDPIPEDDNYDDNHVDNLNTWGYERTVIALKYFRAAIRTTLNEGNVQNDYTDSNHLQLDETASDTDDYYNGKTVVITFGPGEDEEYEITDYVGSSHTITIDGTWIEEPDSSSTYKIVKPEPGWDEDKPKMILATTIIDDPEGGDYGRKIVRYDTMDVYYDEGEALILGHYGKEDYPEYDENSVWPPASVSDPDTFFRKRKRGIVINGVLITPLCQTLPPPEIPE